MKRLLSLSLFLMTAMLSFAHDFESGGIYYNITSSTAPYTVAVTYQGTSYSEYKNEYTGSVTIPEKVTYNGKTYSVTSIGYWAFGNCSNLTSITIPNSVTTIGEDAFNGTAWYDNQPNGLVYAGKVAHEYKGTMPSNTKIALKEGTLGIGDKAFYGCSGLTSVTIPNSVTNIGSSAFEGCSGLTSVTIPNSVTSISNRAFNSCSGLTSVTIPNSVTSIGSYAFYNCSDLTSVTIPNSVTAIGDCVFSGCSGLTSVTINSNSIISKEYSSTFNLSNILGSQVKSYIIGDGVTAIGDYAFFKCSGLTSVTIPNSVTSIGDYAFSVCSGLTSVEIPNSVTTIGDYAFMYCRGLTSITIPNSVKTIGSYAFYGCSGLTSVTIPNSVTSIGDYAFNGCSGLTSVEIPNSVTSIGDGAFAYCSGLTKVIVPDIAAWCNISFDGYAANPLSYAKHIYSDENTEITDLVIPNSVTSIGSYAFYNCSGLTSVTIPNSVKTIGKSAFSRCSSLTSVTIGNSVTSIGSDVFYGCNGLINVNINSNSIISKTYSSESNLKNIFGSQVKSYIIGDGVTSIGNSAFEGCSGLTSITIPNSVTTIGRSVFKDCSGLKKVIVPDIAAWCNISFGNYAENPLYYAKHIFSDENTEITDLVIPNSVTSIGSRAFEGCSGLTSITIPNSVTSIGSGAFVSCSGLTSITIGNSVTSIGSVAFYSCSGLKSVTIPNSVTSIGDYAFKGCSGLTSIVVEKGNTKYDSRNNCNAIIETASNTLIRGCKTTVIPNSVKTIGSYAFDGCIGLTSVTIPNSVTSIGSSAFYYCIGLKSVTLPNSVTNIGYDAFSGCTGLKKLTSYIQKPFYIYNNCWKGVNKSIPLYVPARTKEKYQSANFWKDFTNIIEFGGERIEPLTEPQEVDMAVVPDQISLNGMVVGNTYYVLDADNGDGADSENGCVVINTTTTDKAVDGIAGKDISDASVKAAFKGIIFMVPAGTGTISINAETLGTSSLKVKIGSQPAQAFQLAERATVQIPYTVAEPTYVYIYAGTGTQAARSVGAARATAAENSVKVYSYKWEPTDPTGISSVDNSQSATDNEAGEWYTIDGRKLSGKPVQKGIYIVNGRKVAVK